MNKRIHDIQGTTVLGRNGKNDYTNSGHYRGLSINVLSTTYLLTSGYRTGPHKRKTQNKELRIYLTVSPNMMIDLFTHLFPKGSSRNCTKVHMKTQDKCTV